MLGMSRGITEVSTESDFEDCLNFLKVIMANMGISPSERIDRFHFVIDG